jgi:hypothetical protein
MPDEPFRMSANLEFELATEQTEAQFRQLLKNNPLRGNINLLLTREPNAFHAAGASGDVYELMLAYRREPRQLVGSGARYEMDGYINGKISRIGYLGELRVDGGFQQRRTLLIEAYRAMRRQHLAGSTPAYITTIIADNQSTRRLLEAGLADMPTYQPLETILTLTIPAQQAARIRAPKMSIEQGSEAGMAELAQRLARTGASYQFHPAWTANTLGSPQRTRGIRPEDFVLASGDKGIRGSLCLWDQRTFKQTIVAGYSKRLARLRPAFNLLAPLLRQPRLPSPGQALQGAFLSHLSVDQYDEAALLALVNRAARTALTRGIDYLMLGLAERNPLCRILQARFSCHKFASMLYLVYWEDGRDFAAAIDNRIPHPEMAIL